MRVCVCVACNDPSSNSIPRQPGLVSASVRRVSPSSKAEMNLACLLLTALCPRRHRGRVRALPNAPTQATPPNNHSSLRITGESREHAPCTRTFVEYLTLAYI